jgi:hypothetical protein
MQLRQAYIYQVVAEGRGAAPGDVYTSMAV